MNEEILREDQYTVCDRCGQEIPVAEANDADHLGYGALCNECYALEDSKQSDLPNTLGGDEC